MIYLACFAVSVLFAHFANKATDKKKFWLFFGAGIAVMVLLAGLRDYSIGIDVERYFTLSRYWKSAVSADSLFAYMEYYMSLGRGEPLFALIMGIIAQWTGEYRVFLFVAHFIIITCVYIGAFRLRKQVDPALVLAIFFLFFFNHSLNIIRQYMAMALVFAALADLMEKRYIRYGLVIIVAAMIHTTAVIAFLPLLIHVFLNFRHEKFTLSLRKRQGIVVGLAGLGVLCFTPLMYLLMHIGVLNDRYDFFLESDQRDPAMIIAGIGMLGIAAALYFRKSIQEQNRHFDFYIVCSIVYVILLGLTFTVAYGKRVALYFAFIDIITIAVTEHSQKDRKMRWIMRGAIIGVCLVYWLYVYAFRNASHTVPYLFGF